jgi:glycosyltransferase involved in cell wall biosynthesis
MASSALEGETMKLCLALPKGKAGGVGTFMRHFVTYLTQNGLPFTHDLTADYDILFVNSWTIPYADILRHKRRLPALRVVQRVDGSAQDYGRRDGADWIQRDVNALADLTIYQSRYSYEVTYQRRGLMQQDGPIIYNPVDLTHFHPQDPREENWPPHPTRLISLSWSNNPMKGNWRIPLLAQQYPQVEFVLVGGHLEHVPANVRLLPATPHADLPHLLRSASAYLSLIRNDACPNVILEAMACGLPILYVPSGGVPELVGEAGLPFESDAEFGAGLEALRARRDFYASLARARAESRHDPETIFPRYLEAINACQRRPLPPLWQGGRAWLDAQAFFWRAEFKRLARRGLK